MNMLNKLSERKIFIISVSFLVMALWAQNLTDRLLQIKYPSANTASRVNVLDEIVKPKIEKTPNEYRLNEKSSLLVPQAQASAGKSSSPHQSR